MEELINYYKESVKYDIPTEGTVYIFSLDINGNVRKKISSDFDCFAKVVNALDNKCIIMTMGIPQTNVDDYTEIVKFENVTPEDYVETPESV